MYNMSKKKTKKQSTIARLPDEPVITSVKEEDKDALLLSLIKKGGKSAKLKNEDKIIKKVTLRLTAEMNERITSAAKSRMIEISNHKWMLEAIHQKLKKEGF